MTQASSILFIGNAIVDVVATCEEDFIERQRIAKGVMTLIDADRACEIYAEMGPAIETSGGSAANTAFGFAALGGNSSFIGIVGNDQLGEIFRHDLKASGVDASNVLVTPDTATGRCLVLVTPDAGRTMATSLGASATIAPHHVDSSMIASADIIYLEGYLLDHPQAWPMFHKTAEQARRAGKRIAITLSDPMCVERHRAALANFLPQAVDILFANEQEIMALCQTEELDTAINQARSAITTVAVTRSADGAVLAHGGEKVTLAAEPVDKVVDTTGAGDFFAAGLLYGLSRGLSLDEVGRFAARAAAEAIVIQGPRPSIASLARLLH